MLVFAIGIANALGRARACSAILPTLVPREDLPGAVALTSVQMNLSRVIGPAIGGMLYATFDAAPVFAINALTYVFAVIGLLWARYPRRAERARRRARAWPACSRACASRAAIRCSRTSSSRCSRSRSSRSRSSGSCRQIAEHDLGIDPKSAQYGVLYACFGLGAALGAITVGTVFAHATRRSCCGPGFVAFAVVLARVRAAPQRRGAAYVVIALLGYAYFVVITSLSTVLQQHLDDSSGGG